MRTSIGAYTNPAGSVERDQGMTSSGNSSSSRGSSSALLAFIARPADERFFDPMYALRLCSQHGRSLACVHLYSAMGLWEEAVDLALTGACWNWDSCVVLHFDAGSNTCEMARRPPIEGGEEAFRNSLLCQSLV